MRRTYTIINEAVDEDIFADPMLNDLDNEIMMLVSAQQFHKSYPHHV